jgi:hypothetical protein
MPSFKAIVPNVVLSCIIMYSLWIHVVKGPHVTGHSAHGYDA